MSGTYNRKDHLYKQAKADGYRSRASYKLVELDKRFRFLKRGARIVDLGCAPGGWVQVAAEKVGPTGRVVGVDLVAIDPMKPGNNHVSCIEGDMTLPETQEQARQLLGGKADAVLSDMSPSISGIKLKDSAQSAELVAAAMSFAESVLQPGGLFVAKIFPGEDCDQLGRELRGRFSKFSRLNLDSSRTTSIEQYFVGQGFRG